MTFPPLSSWSPSDWLTLFGGIVAFVAALAAVVVPIVFALARLKVAKTVDDVARAQAEWNKRDISAMQSTVNDINRALPSPAAPPPPSPGTTTTATVTETVVQPPPAAPTEAKQP